MAVSLQIATANVDATRSEVGPHRPPAASTDVEVAVVVTVVMMTVVVMMAMTVMMMTVMMAVMAMTMMATVAMTVATVTTSRSRGNSSSGQSDRGSGCESDFTKHICSLRFARRDCLMRL